MAAGNTAESLASGEQGGETSAPTVLPAEEARLRSERNQTFEDNPAKVSRQTATEMHRTCFIKPHGRRESVTLVTAPFHSGGNMLELGLSILTWTVETLFFVCLFFFAYSEMHKFTI